MHKIIHPIQFITQEREDVSHLDSAKLALEAGCKWIQLRVKSDDIEWIRNCATLVQVMCANYGAQLIINDHLEVASEFQTAGLHLGLEDISITEAKRILKPHQIVGGTAHTVEEMMAVAKAGADYIGLGPYRYTQTKSKLRPVLGSEEVQRRIAALRKEGYKTPVVVVGGIQATDAATIKGCGAQGIAFSGALLQHKTPKKMIQQLEKVWK